jgi:hypothetical protein
MCSIVLDPPHLKETGSYLSLPPVRFALPPENPVFF